MKKVLAWVLLLTLIVGAFAGCKKTDPVQVTEPSVTEPANTGKVAGANDAIEYLKGFYKDDGSQTPVDYTRFGIVRVGGVAFDVVWTVDVGEDLIKVIVNDDGTVTIDINEECPEDTEYTLTATVTDAQGNTVSHSWTHILPKAQDMVEIIKAAYALAPGESLPYESRLIGKIISIDTIWTDEYQNIGVTIEVTGAEDMPIKCYRMKANDTTIEIIKDLKVGNIITVRGILKNYEGIIEFDAGCILEKVEKGDAIDAPTDAGQILKEAYALAENKTLPYQATLTGTVTEIDTPYDPAYGNICVVIEVEGYPEYPILCYRLKGTGVDQIAIGDLITVTGIIKNYKGTIEYDAGCMMTNRVSGGGVAQGPSSDAAKILADAAKLNPGEKLPYRATLTGEITSVDTPYSSQYGNVTVTMKVNGVKIQCYRMVGDGIDQIRETDTITVSGVIENYNGKLEFGLKCNLDSWTKGPRNVNYGPVKEDVAYKMYMEQGALDKTLYFNGQISGNRMSTTTDGSKGADVFGERISGKGVRFYDMDGNTKTYIEIEEYTNNEGKQRGRALVTTTPSCYWVYDADTGVYAVNLPTAGKYFLGTYNTYETITASWLGYIDGTMNGSNQYVAKFIESDKVSSSTPSDTVVKGTPVEEPVVGTGYKFGFYQNQLDGKPFLAFAGKMSGFYAATSEVISGMVDVYLENADGGYYLYFMDGNTKTYIDIVERASDATKVDIALQTSGTHTVYQLNTEHNYVYTSVVGSEWYLGTFNQNNSISASKTSYISDTSKIGVSQFCAWFCTVEEVEGEPENPTEPEATEPEATEPSTGTTDMVTSIETGKAYKWGVEQKNVGKTLYFAGTTANQDYYLSTTVDFAAATDVYLEAADGGYYLYFMAADGTKTYVDLYLSANGYQNIRLVTEPSAVFTYDETYNTLVAPVEGTDCYIGAYKTFETFSCSKYSYISTSFPSHFYAEGEGSEPEATEPEGEVYDIVPGKNLTVALEHTAKIATVSFKYTMGEGTFNMALSTADGAAYYGYFAFDKHGNVDKYDGITVEKLSDNSYYVTIEIAELNKMTGDPKGDIAVFYLRGAWTDGNGTISELNITEETAEPEATEPAGDEFTVNYNFANCAKGPEQYVAETHELDDITTLDIVGCHMNTQLRIYQDAKYDGNAVFTCANAIKSLALNAGFKAASLEIYGSVDGTNWVLIDTLTTAVAYGDFVVDFPANTAYRYLKLDATGAQVRVANIAITFKN